MRRTFMRWLVLALVMMLAFSSQAAAFSDLPETDEAREKIIRLQEQGIINGVNGAFFGDKELTYAEGIHMIVKGLDLSLDAHQVEKAPKAEDYYDHVPEDAWYAESLIIAAAHGLELGRDLDPHAVMTREAYAHYLIEALNTTGVYPFTLIYFVINDESEIDPAYVNNIQLLLNAGIVQLDEELNFYPKQPITRRDAALWLHDTIEFKNQSQIVQSGTDPENGEVTFEVTPINEEVSKITVYWGEQPHPGYGIRINAIEFVHEEMTAVVYYERLYPDPDLMYPQVIVYPKAAAYVPAGYSVVIDERASETDSKIIPPKPIELEPPIKIEPPVKRLK